MIKVNKPGQSMPLVEKRSVESIVYTVSLAELLSTNEVATSVKSTECKLPITDVRLKQGKTIDIKVPASNLGDKIADYPVTILFTTNAGNTRAAVFTIRVYK